nr:immunoglobulin heavy chain junction region [Macaca mulatta]MOX01033.1 immunoglobulin heavy chain junction region [Macaca mulatta]MOX03402.1 immunoglobulin heavy chain junction region [Macaca mulatta]MOX03758.1 immunoglobulin heavy chain junction region [Macaca mulatta]MOX05726.1 immunoglobulin heavy chain junction region [Macaca mulatta]
CARGPSVWDPPDYW